MRSPAVHLVDQRLVYIREQSDRGNFADEGLGMSMATAGVHGRRGSAEDVFPTPVAVTISVGTNQGYRFIVNAGDGSFRSRQCAALGGGHRAGR